MKAPRALVAAAATVLAAGCSATDPFEDSLAPVLPSTGAVVSEHPLATKAGLLALEAGAMLRTRPSRRRWRWRSSTRRPATWEAGDSRCGFLAGVNRKRSISKWHQRGLTSLATGWRRRCGLRAVPRDAARRRGAWKSSGALRALHTAWLGPSPFLKLCEPAIRLAEEGFTVDAWLARTLRRESIRALLGRDPGARQLFYPNGNALAEGDRLVRPRWRGPLASWG